MAKNTARPGKSRRPPGSFRALMERGGYTPARLEVTTGVSVRTVYRALAGSVPMGSNLRALALALGVSEQECRAAIERGSEEAA